MSKLTIPNKPGHYELSGIEINVFPSEIIITTRGGYQDHNYDTSRHHAAPRPKEEEPNMSLLSSVSTIAQKFGKKN